MRHPSADSPVRGRLRRLVWSTALLVFVPRLAVADEAQAIRPFTIQVDDALLEDLRERLDRTRWPDQVDRTGWMYGVDVGYMKRLVDYWRTQYDWRQQERMLNGFSQFKTRVDGIDLHFLHVRSQHADAQPLVLVHGWPGSVHEFYKIIPMLTQPEKHGGRPERDIRKFFQTIGRSSSVR